MLINFKNTIFLKSALDLDACPTEEIRGKPLPEIAVVGRSNVGKSSLLNDLFGSKQLVKTAKKPGKTTTLNFFNCDSKVLFVDLPGYGYAATSFQVKKEWGTALTTYLRKREALSLFLLLLDIRREPTLDDFQILACIQATHIPYLIVFTKIDKLNQSELKTQTEKLCRAIAIEVPFVHYSSLKKQGRKELIRLIEETLYG